MITIGGRCHSVSLNVEGDNNNAIYISDPALLQGSDCKHIPISSLIIILFIVFLFLAILLLGCCCYYRRRQANRVELAMVQL